MKIKKAIYTALAVFQMLFLAVSCEKNTPDLSGEQGADEYYIQVDLPDLQDAADQTRVAYSYNQSFYDWGEGSISARWELGDVIKVYETKVDPDGNNTDVYENYEAYAAAFPFPYAPTVDKYYRFECVGGAGTAHGIFKYVGLVTVTVVGADPTDPTNFNVNIDAIYNHKIPDWEKFDGLVIYGNPLRNYMMRHQSQKQDPSHLKYGQRMKGHFCGHNFQSWFENPQYSSQGAGADGLLLYNTASCVIRIDMGGFNYDVYGGAELTVKIPGMTTGHPTGDYRNKPLSLTLGDPDDHQELKTPWATANPGKRMEHTYNNTISAYVVGWPATLSPDAKVEVQLYDHHFGKIYTWTLSRSDGFIFKEGYYYVFNLLDDNFVMTEGVPETD